VAISCQNPFSASKAVARLPLRQLGFLVMLCERNIITAQVNYEKFLESRWIKSLSAKMVNSVFITLSQFVVDVAKLNHVRRSHSSLASASPSIACAKAGAQTVVELITFVYSFTTAVDNSNTMR